MLLGFRVLLYLFEKLPACTLCLFREATAKNLKHREKQKDLHSARGS